MYYDFEDYLNTLIKNKVNNDQFFFCYLLYYNKIDALYRYLTHSGKKFMYDDIDELQKRKLIRSITGKPAENADEFELTENGKKMFKAINEFGREFWRQYPHQISLDSGKKIPGKSMDIDEFLELYTKKVGNNAEKHKEILKKLEYAKRKDMINMGIRKWVASEQYDSISLPEEENDIYMNEF